MALLILLLLVMAFGLGGILKIALVGRSRRIASAAGWVLLAFPALAIFSLLLKWDGPLFWFTLPHGLFTPWVSLPLLVLCILIPIRSAWRRAQIHRDEAILLEQARVLDTSLWPELGYQSLADQLGVPAFPIFMSKDVRTSYAMGIRARRIVVPAAWVPAKARGVNDEYWADIEDSPVSAADMKAILAHELAHHRDAAGLRGVLMELAGYLFPWEFVVGTGTDYREGRSTTRRIRKFRLFMTGISALLAKFGKIVWRGALDAERERQERVADQEAERVFPPARSLIESMRGVFYSEPLNQSSRASQVIALSAGIAFLLFGLMALPGRAAWMRLAGGESPIPWNLPEGWSLAEWVPPAHIGSIGYLPKKGDTPPRIRIDYASRPYTRNSFGMVNGWIRFPENLGAMMPDSAHIVVDWAATYRGPGNPWSTGKEKDMGPVFLRVTLDRLKDPELRLTRGQVLYDGITTFTPAGKNRTMIHMDWGPFPSFPLAGSTVILGIVLNRDSPGTYDIEPPLVKVVRPDGTWFRLDPANLGLFDPVAMN